MKIKNFLRFLLIAVAAVMVFSLFACIEEPETETTTEEIENTTESSDDKKPEDSEKDTDDSESTPVGGDTESSTESVSDEESSSEEESTSETEPGCQHVEETIAGKAATCTEAGLTDGKKCSVCGEILVEQEVIPAGHTEETIAGKAATCTETGLTDGKKCSVCDEVLVEQEEIAALGHNKVDKTFTAPTTAEDGWYAHKYCEACGTAWSTEDEELDAVPAIDKIVPQSEVYLGVVELAGKVVSGAPVEGNPSKFKAPVISEDRTYVRFERDGASNDGNIMLIDNEAGEITGQYMIIKYRTNNQTVAQVWANTTEYGHSGGAASCNQSLVADEQWHLLVIDFTKSLGNYVKANDEGKYAIKWARFDLFDELKEEGYVDIAYVIYCDDPADVKFALQEGDEKLCPHTKKTEPTYTPDGDKHITDCSICGSEIVENHIAASDVAWDAEQKLYVGKCICGGDFTSEMLYVSEASLAGSNKCFVAEQKDGFVRYTVTSSGTDDPYAHVYRYGDTVTGQYMVIRYRLVNGGINPTNRNFFAGTAASGYNGAKGDGDQKVTPGTFVADGEWHCMLVTFQDANPAFVANEDGTYTWAYLRLAFNPAAFDNTCYLDIDEIAFADNLLAAERYIAKNGIAPFVTNIDKSNCSLNGETFTEGGQATDMPFVIDMTDKTLNSADAIKVGGWFVTPGGVDSYKLRITTDDGSSVVVDWLDDLGALSETDGVTKVGTNKGWSTDCRYGARFGSATIDLSDYAGKTVDVEVIAVSNYGAQIVAVQLNNITVTAPTPVPEG